MSQPGAAKPGFSAEQRGSAPAAGQGGAPEPGAKVHSFVHEAMASMFEVRIAGEEAGYARSAADAAFQELDRLDAQLSRFSPSSDVCQINALKAGRRLRVGIATFECLQTSAQVCRQTGGAFDVTIGRLYALWQPRADAPPHPSDAELAAARELTGMDLVELHEEDFSVSVRRAGVRIDLGGIGKGYAVDRMIDILREWSVKTALVHGGQSSVYCLGAPPGRKGWTLNLRGPGEQGEAYGRVDLKDRSLSGSAVLDKWRHVIDPRTGRPAMGHAGAWAIAPTATLTDCLSTAFMVMSAREVEEYCRQHPEVSGMLLDRGAAGSKLLKFGKWDE